AAIEGDSEEEQDISEEGTEETPATTEGDLEEGSAVMVPQDDPLPPQYDDDVVLQACQQEHEEPIQKLLTLARVRELGLVPYWTRSPQGEIRASLSHMDVVASLHETGINSPVFVPDPSTSILSRMRNSTSELRSKASDPSLESVLALSPISRVFRGREYVVLTQEFCNFLNEDWRMFPSYRFACARMLGGCILHNTRNGAAILVNTLEVYGGSRLIDIHRESTRNGKSENSVPNASGSYYDRVLPTSMALGAGFEQRKLIIRTDMFDALVTCSTRLDAAFRGPGSRHSVGPTNHNFTLSSDGDRNSARIYLDKECVQAAHEIAKDINAYRVVVGSANHQLRQLRTAFDDPFTYCLCRGWGPLTSSNVCQPYTIFTIGQNDLAIRGNGHAVGKLFDNIAFEVLKRGEHATLSRETVQSARDSCNDGGDVTKALNAILTQYQDDTGLPILSNKSLNTPLETLANCMSPYLSKGNSSVTHFLTDVLK
ncbi:hypothetical protein BGZ65_002186, partial [Modicella reniformis]